jgi:hypothetical protein
MHDSTSEVTLSSLAVSCKKLFRPLLSRKMQILNFVSIAKEDQTLRKVLGWSCWIVRVRVWYLLCRNFPASWNRFGAAVKKFIRRHALFRRESF